MTKTIKQGFRQFKCDNCHLCVSWPCRDYESPSCEVCPECTHMMNVANSWADSSLPVDELGNLKREELE